MAFTIGDRLTFNRISFFQLLEGQDKQLGIVFVGKGTRTIKTSIGHRGSSWNLRKWNGSKLAAFKPMYGGSVNGHGFFSTDVWSIFEITVLSLLLCLQVETCRVWLTQHRGTDTIYIVKDSRVSRPRFFLTTALSTVAPRLIRSRL